MPHYPFSPAVLDALPEELAELYRGLEDTLLQEICSRLNVAGELNEVTVDAIKALRSHGIPLDDIKKAIAKTNSISMKKLDALFDDVVARNQAYYSSLIDLAHVTAPETLVDHAAIYAIYQQTKGELRNITRSMGFMVRDGRGWKRLPPAKSYQWALDQAVLEIESGAINYNQAIRRAVKQLADSGLKRVDYASGHVDHIDVAARRAVMTGVNQLNQKYREQSMDYLETDLVETTAHLGARNVQGPNGWEAHTEWQGKVYRWNRGSGESKAERPKVPEPLEPQAASTGNVQQTQPQRRGMGPLDVTQEYLNAAAPGQGSITYEDGYQTKNHQDEIKMAQWLLRTFGGDIRLLREAKTESTKRADYMWRNALWELKGAHSINAADKRFQHAIKQIQDNPGGFILNVLEDMDMVTLERQLTRRFYREESKINALDLMILSKGNLVKVLRYKK